MREEVLAIILKYGRNTVVSHVAADGDKFEFTVEQLKKAVGEICQRVLLGNQ